MTGTVAALFVDPKGPYVGIPGVDPWDADRDARLYSGPWPVVAHPPCAKWSTLARVNEARWGRRQSSDGGCFASAMLAVRAWGGVLEHPAMTQAWPWHGIARPPRNGGWIPAGGLFGGDPGWTCEVAQGRYGHVGCKRTWLYAVMDDPSDLPDLRWSDAPRAKLVTRPHVERSQRYRSLNVEYMTKSERLRTPPEFREVLLGIARKSWKQ